MILPLPPVLWLLSFLSFTLMAAVDIAYGHSIVGKIAALILFLLGVSLALAALDSSKPTPKG